MIEFIYMPPHIDTEAGIRISEVQVRIGQRVCKGQLLFTYEFDGALFEERAVKSGTVSAIFFKNGDTVGGNTPIIACEVI